LNSYADHLFNQNIKRTLSLFACKNLHKGTKNNGIFIIRNRKSAELKNLNSLFLPLSSQSENCYQYVTYIFSCMNLLK